MSVLAGFFDTAANVPKLLFILFVTLATVAPRMPLDEPWTIGGNLSHSFRKILILTAVSYLFRNLCFSSQSFHGMGADVRMILQGFEGVLLCFLSLLTPYLLLTWLATRINLGRQSPGQTLQPWILSIATLNALSVVARIVTGKTELWVFKKLADALSFIPVMRTLQLYNRVTNSQTRYAGRGSVLSQVVAVSEYVSLMMNGADALSKMLFLVGILSQETLQSTPVKGMYGTNLYAGYFRILCHGILLNVLDEAYTIGASSSSSSGSPPGGGGASRDNSSSARHAASGPTVETVDDDNDQEVGLSLALLSSSKK